jgi:hypothetical protein
MARKKPPKKGKGAAKKPAKTQAKGGKKQAKSKVPSTQDILAAARKETAAASDVARADATKAGVCTGQWKSDDTKIRKEFDSYMTYAETKGSTDRIIHPALICSWVHDVVIKRKVAGSTMLKHLDHLLFAYRAQWSADGGALKMKDLGYAPDTKSVKEFVNVRKDLSLIASTKRKTAILVNHSEAVPSLEAVDAIFAAFDEIKGIRGNGLRVMFNALIKLCVRSQSILQASIHQLSVSPGAVGTTGTLQVLVFQLTNAKNLLSQRSADDQYCGIIRDAKVQRCVVSDIATQFLWRLITVGGLLDGKNALNLDDPKSIRRTPAVALDHGARTEKDKVKYPTFYRALKKTFLQLRLPHIAVAHLPRYIAVREMERRAVHAVDRNRHGGWGEAKDQQGKTYGSGLSTSAYNSLAGFNKDDDADAILHAAPRTMISIPGSLLQLARKKFIPFVEDFEAAHADDTAEAKDALQESHRMCKLLKWFVRVVVQDAPFRRRLGIATEFYAHEFFLSELYLEFENSSDVELVNRKVSGHRAAYISPAAQALIGTAFTNYAADATHRDEANGLKIQTLTAAVRELTAEKSSGASGATSSSSASSASSSAPPREMRLALSSAPPAKFTVPLLTDIVTFSNLYRVMVRGYDGSGALRNKRLPEKSTANERGKFNKLTLMFAMIEGKKRKMKRITTETEDESLARAALALDKTVQKLKEAKCKKDLFQVWKMVGKTGANETTTAYRRLHSFLPQRTPQHRGRKHGAIRLLPQQSTAPKITALLPPAAPAARGKTPAKAKAKAQRRYPRGKGPKKRDPPAKQQPAPKRQRRGLSLDWHRDDANEEVSEEDEEDDEENY